MVPESAAGSPAGSSTPGRRLMHISTGGTTVQGMPLMRVPITSNPWRITKFRRKRAHRANHSEL